MSGMIRSLILVELIDPLVRSEKFAVSLRKQKKKELIKERR